MFFHLSLFSGRTDSLNLEASSFSKVLNFFNTFSSATVRNIKQIVYSKDKFINYSSSNYVHEDVYKKVLVYALSENHSKVYTLFDIKKSVDEEKIRKQFMKLYIKDEPIIDFANIQFFNEGDLSPIDIDNLYQVSYKRNNKTKLEELYAPNWETLLTVCNELIGGEVIELRKYLFVDSTKKDYELDTNKSQKVRLVHGNNKVHSFSIPRVKKSVSLTVNDIENTFLVSNNKPDSVSFY